MEEKRGKEFRSFSAMAEDLKDIPRLNLPELDLEIDSIDEIERKAQEVRQEAKRASAWVTKMQGKLDELFSRLSEDAQKLVKEKTAKIESARDALFSHLNEVVRRETRKAFLLHCLSRSFKDQEQLKECLDQLVKQGHLIRDEQGPLQASFQTFNVPRESGFTPEDLSEMKVKLEKVCSGLKSAFRRVARSRTEFLLEQGNTTLKELAEGRPGECAFFVPPKRLIDEDGGETWLASATVLVQSNGTDIFPLQVVGHERLIQAFERARELQVRLHVSSLDRPSPPFVRTNPLERGVEIRRLWYLVKQGISHAERLERLQVFKDSMAEKANLSVGEFFLKRKPGVCLVAYNGTWRNNGNNYPSLFLLVKREEEDGGKFLSIEEVPNDEELQKLLAPCLGTRYPEDEKFEKVARPLQSVLKAVYGATSKAEKIQS